MPNINKERKMKNVILSMAAVIGLAGTTFAGQPNNSHNSSHHENSEHSRNEFSRDSRNEFSRDNRFEFSRDNRFEFSRVKFEHGYYYEGFEHSHWSKIYFNSFYGCKIYFDPYTRSEYYWCVPDHRFYPVSYKPYGKYVF
jgi:hypothetical protein